MMLFCVLAANVRVHMTNAGAHSSMSHAISRCTQAPVFGIVYSICHSMFQLVCGTRYRILNPFCFGSYLMAIHAETMMAHGSKRYNY